MIQEKDSPTVIAPLPCIRPAVAGDLPRLIELVNSAYSIEDFLEGTRTDPERMDAMQRKGKILVAEEDSGLLLGCVYTELRGERGYLGMLAVDPARQGRGLARLLMDAAEEQLRSLGCKAVDILVLNLRPELLPTYRRFGYLESGTEAFNFPRSLKPGVECHCIRMSKAL